VFDRFVVVDWSANSVPKRGRDSIWIAVHDRDGELSVTNPATRTSAEAFLTELLDDESSPSTLIGVDFSLGFPAGTAGALGLGGVAWTAMWELLADQVRDDHRNSNNRFVVAAELNRRLTGAASPFWGCPPAASSPTLASTKPPGPEVVPSWRAVEEVLRRQGHRPFSSWQLLGAGAVGSQSLLGIPMIRRLHGRFADRVQVWPFTTGLEPPEVADGSVVVVEVWPSLLPVERSSDAVRDALQVSTTARWLAGTDATGELGSLFSPVVAPDIAAAAVAEEGWVLGVRG
jgi:precorrin-8X/cobalt-precorrin-8 methylmutase